VDKRHFISLNSYLFFTFYFLIFGFIFRHEKFVPVMLMVLTPINNRPLTFFDVRLTGASLIQ